MNRGKNLVAIGAHLRWLSVTVSAGVLVAACAQQVTVPDDDGASNGGGPASTAAVGGMGGMGSGGAGGEETSACPVDCSTITTPACTEAICDEPNGQCVVVPTADGGSCEDGLFCTANDSCLAGLCQGGPLNECGMAPDACQLVTCDEPSKTCAQAMAPNGDPCNPTDLCQVNATCNNGLCFGTPNDCFFAPVPNDCHIPVCNPNNGMCEPQIGNEGLDCVDVNDLCTVSKTCVTGVCQGGAPKDCSALTQGCNDGLCDVVTGLCYQQPIMPGMMCADATDACNNGICDMNGVCQPNATNEGGVCDDGLSCTSGETCTTGVCGGGMSNITIYFSEDFASNAVGWTLDNEWQIGPAMSSPAPGACGNGDPGQDHSTSADNGIAGVIIGGTAATALHPFTYVTSPMVDTSAVVGPLILSYHRWLNSDYTPYMQNNVEVWDGTTWVVVWQTGSFPGVQDAAWMPQQHDIAAYKNNAMQVRFGFTITSSGVYTCPSWNLDDVLIASGSCI